MPVFETGAFNHSATRPVTPLSPFSFLLSPFSFLLSPFSFLNSRLRGRTSTTLRSVSSTFNFLPRSFLTARSAVRRRSCWCGPAGSFARAAALWKAECRDPIRAPAGDGTGTLSPQDGARALKRPSQTRARRIRRLREPTESWPYVRLSGKWRIGVRVDSQAAELRKPRKERLGTRMVTRPSWARHRTE
jgi:hypothetical protein